jgi:hypothetical protein
VSGLKIDYARVSSDAQDLTAQRDALQARGVQPERIYVDHSLTRTHRDRPGVRRALAVPCGSQLKRSGDGSLRSWRS